MNCKTDGAIYETVIKHNLVICKVYLPAEFNKDKTKIFTIGIENLKQRIHNGMEEALSPLFPQY